jgi:hypothetical protein
VREEDGHVADHAHPLLVAILLELQPLAEEDVLEELVRLDLLGELAPRPRERVLCAPRQPRRPRVPRLALVLVLERGEERVVFEPEAREVLEADVVAAQALVRALLEILEGPSQQPALELDDLAVFDALVRKLLRAAQV